MFAVRGMAVSLAFFGLLYCLLSVVVALAWRPLKFVPMATQQGLARLLFGLRILPLTVSTLLTCFLVVPSFGLLEPRSIDEQIGAMPLALGVCAIILIAGGMLRLVSTQTRTSRLAAWWLEGASPMDSGEGASTFRSRRDVPPLTLVGICRPKVLVSESAVARLSQDELQIALRHEIAHMRSRDNLKKLVFRLSPFPGMVRLESAWSQAAELAADDAAVSNLRNAVDLAAALVKLSRLVPVAAVVPACTVGFVSGSIETRVARLLAWEASNVPPSRNRRWYAIPSLLAVLLGVLVTYGPALTFTHELTEWLVR
jgi:Zn-dependent protease with chaperone function